MKMTRLKTIVGLCLLGVLYMECVAISDESVHILHPVHSGIFRTQNFSRYVGTLVMTAFCSYIAYCFFRRVLCFFNMYDSEECLAITERDRSLLLSLVDGMKEDIEQIKSGNIGSSVVKHFDLSGMEPELAVECNMLQSGFIQMYNACEQNEQDVRALESLYHELQGAVERVLCKT